MTFDGIIETGTYLGTTTAMFAETGLPVYSVECNPRYFAYASRRFRRNRHRVHLFECDSITFLKQISRDSQLAKSRLFFYLDAHWGAHLPLLEELRIIARLFPRL